MAAGKSPEENKMDDPWREVEVVWREDGTFLGMNPKKATVQMGSAEGKPGISPMEMILMGVGGCTGMDVANILKKKREPVEAIKLRVRGKRVEEYPQVYSEIEVEYLIYGNGIDPKAVEQAIKLSEEKYCSVSAMLRKSVELRWSYQILALEVIG